MTEDDTSPWGTAFNGWPLDELATDWHGSHEADRLRVKFQLLFAQPDILNRKNESLSG